MESEPTSVSELVLLAVASILALVTGCMMAYGLYRIFGFLVER